MNMKRFALLFLISGMAGILVACGGEPVSPVLVLTPPAISFDLRGEECPSIEVQAGTQIAWTNRGTIDRILLLEREDEAGAIIESGGTDLLQPGTTFSITLIEPGQYTYYCSEDRTAFGTITVLP